jgi:endonuclease/exonuclease/phosphatase family metal-dependent hydrolase
MRVATWNIYWLGERTGEKIVRSESDYNLIAQVIDRLSPDVLALEEIVDPLVMQQILTLASTEGRDYIIKTSDTNWLTSDSKPLDTEKDLQKVFLCINNKTVEFIRGAAINGGPGGRRPYAARLRERLSGKEFVVVGVHLRSGFPNFLGPEDAKVRRKEVEALIKWLGGEAQEQNHAFPKPDSDDVVVLGDCNAEKDDPNQSLSAMGMGFMSNWLWDKPAPDGGHWETALYEGDRFVIDFILLSPSLRNKVVSPPSVYAWDYDAALGGPSKFHEGPNGSGSLKGYGVSDHRPVVTEVQF